MVNALRFWLIAILMLTASVTRGQIVDHTRATPTTMHWQLLETDHFNFFHQPGYEQIVKIILPKCLQNLHSIEDKIGYRLSGRLDIYIYPSHAVMHALYVDQNLKADDVLGGITNVQTNNIHVYHPGSQIGLLNQISDAIAKNLLIEMLYGGTVQERIKYATLMHLPTWFGDGLAQYLARGWDGAADNVLRDAFNTSLFNSFNRLTPELQALAGRSMWHYLELTEGSGAIQRILYLVRLTRKVETALYFVAKQTTKQLYDNWHKTQSALYASELKRRMPSQSEPITFPMADQMFMSLDLSSGAKRIAATGYHNGKLTAQVFERETGKSTIIHDEFVYFNGYEAYKSGMLVKWKNDHELFVLVNKQVPVLYLIGLDGEVVSSRFVHLDQVASFDYFAKTGEMILSGSKLGISNLYLISEHTASMVPLTNDDNDELNPSFDLNGNIYFSKSLPRIQNGIESQSQFDVFFLMRATNNLLFSNVTKTDEFDEFMPIAMRAAYMSFLSDRNGIINAYAYTLSEEIYALSDYQSNILWQSTDATRSKIAEVLLRNGVMQVYISDVEASSNLGVVLHPTYTHSRRELERINSIPTKSKLETENITLSDSVTKVYFQSAFPIPSNVDSLELITGEDQEIKTYEVDTVLGTFLKITPTALYSSLDNSNFLTNQFPAFAPFERQMLNTFGFTLGIRLEDQYKSNSFDLRMRSTVQFDRFQFRMKYVNRKGIWVKELTAKTEGFIVEESGQFLRQKMRSLQGEFTRPLTKQLSVTFIENARVDNMVQLASSNESFETKPLLLITASHGFRLNYNTTYNQTLWTYSGLQASVKSLLVNAINLPGASFNTSLSMGYGLKLGQHFFWMNRLHAGNSLGKHRTSYFIGGTPNQISPNYKSNVVLTDNLAYISPVYGVRNTNIGIRNGHSYTFLNSEIYAPLHRWVGKKPLKNNALQNLWVVGFCDIGAAWYGKSPYDRLNPANKSTLHYGALDVTIYNTKNPLVYSLGAGLRTTILGYLVRYDVAYTLDNNQWGRHLQRVSLSHPF